MKHTELNNNLIGKKVEGVFTGIKVRGTIVEVFGEYNGNKTSVTDPNVHAKGVRIELDKTVNWGGENYSEYVSTERVMPKSSYDYFVKKSGKAVADKLKSMTENGNGNLKFTNLV